MEIIQNLFFTPITGDLWVDCMISAFLGCLGWETGRWITKKRREFENNK